MGLKNTTECFGQAQYVGAGAVVKLTATPTTGIALPTTGPFGEAIKPSYAQILAESGTFRYTDDGKTAPTATFGTPISGELDYDGNLVNFQAYIPSGVNMNVSYFR